MIIAGDFAQLPPVRGYALYSNDVAKVQDFAHSKRSQESTIGKILWHQFTMVVILKQNMRQRVQSPEDAKLRNSLENMRYAACTHDDIAFLNTRISGKRRDQPQLNDPCFRHVITAWNSQKDKINELGGQHFAHDTGQTLEHFYSVNKLSKSTSPAGKTGWLGNISIGLQRVLWDAPPCTSQHIPGNYRFV